jgi:hypothetical protein
MAPDLDGSTDLDHRMASCTAQLTTRLPDVDRRATSQGTLEGSLGFSYR